MHYGSLNKTYLKGRPPLWFPVNTSTRRSSRLRSICGIVPVARPWRLDADTFSDLRSGSCDRPSTWLSLVLTDDRRAASSWQLTSGRAKSLTLSSSSSRGRMKEGGNGLDKAGVSCSSLLSDRF